jgi:phytoene desaturase
MKRKSAVIGSGIGGISMAIRLRKLGFEVDLYEKNNEIGGKIGEINESGFRFDTGPSLFTLPELVDELFELMGEEDKLKYKKLEIVCQYFWDDGTIVNSFSDAEKFAAELSEKLGENKNNTLGFLKDVADLYDISADVFIFSSLHKMSTWTNPELRTKLPQAKKLKPYKSMYKSLKENFDNQKTIQLFSRYATYNGSNPYKAPSTLNVIAHLEHNIGAFFPKYGMRNIVEKLVELLEKSGVNIILNTLVEKINFENKTAKSILANGKEIDYDLIISDVDVNYLYRNMLPDISTPRKIKNVKLSSSALIFYWGVNKTFSQLQLHNILFSNNYRREFECLFDEKIIYEDPTVYIFISKKIIETDAPKGMENWFVMINSPADKGQIQESDIQKARENVVNKINKTLNVDIEKHIDFEKIRTPKSIEKQTTSFAGALYGANSNSIFSAFNRHANFLRKLKNIYFVGGSVHPGGGIPLCIASSKITESIIKNDFGISD